MTSSDHRSREQTRTYDRRTSVVFCKTQEAFGGLSNMAAGYPLVVNGASIRTSEALYQACRFPHEPEVQRLIIQQTSPMTAKMKSKPHRKKTRSDWDKVRVNIMRWCLRVKLAQNWQKFSDLLLATGDRAIVEESRKDDFWGAKGTDEETLVGMNVLGRLLMELREELRSADRERLRKVEPPAVQQFLLYGRPIGVVEAGSRERADGELFAERVAVGAGHGRETPSVSGQIRHQPPVGAREERAEPHGKEETRNDGVIPKECRRLAEVDFPIAQVSRHAAREEGIKARHPRGLHLWWARRPLASCRAVLLALLWPDPCDPLCPPAFKTEARRRLREVGGCNPGSTDHELRQALLRFVADFASWDNALQRTHVDVSRALVRAAFTSGSGSEYEPPLVLDPFAGGGAIPLEAMRMGCDAVACDLNPIPVLINAVQLEYVPRFGVQLADEFRRWSVRLFDLLHERLSALYPGDEDGALPIAYLWARTLLCTGPNCGADIPLIKQTVISKRRGIAVRILPSAGRVQTQVTVGAATPDSLGTVRGGRVKCPCCGFVISGDEYRARATAGQLGERIYCVVLSTRDGSRQYRDPLRRDIDAFEAARSRLAQLEASDPDFVPQANISANEPRRLNVRYYGFTRWSQLFNDRQKLLLRTLSAALRQVRHEMNCAESDGGLADAVHAALALSISNTIQYNSSMSTWLSDGMISVFIQSSSIPMRADYAEANPLMDRLVGGLRYQFNKTSEAIESIAQIRAAGGSSMSASATTQVYPDESVDIVATDPPYYFAIPYAELSDFFYVWIAHFMREVTPSLFTEPDTPKANEAIQNLAHSKAPAQKDRAHFEATIRSSLSVARNEIKKNGVCLVVFAHASTEGWEALVASLLAAGWTITASWPIETERGGRMLAQRQTSLATSIHLVCRPRPDDAGVGDWADVLRALPTRVTDWMDRLQSEGVRGADLVFACIGPALEIFSRYSRVETADGREVKLAEYLEKVWEVVGRSALEQVLGTAEAKARNGVAGTVEEDARLTALFLWTLQSTNGESAAAGAAETDDDDVAVEDEEEEGTTSGKAKGYALVFDVVRRFAQPLGINLPKWEGRIIETKKGVVRLFPVAERARILFGKDGAEAVAQRLEKAPAADIHQLMLFTENEEEAASKGKGRGRGRRKAGADVPDEALETSREATTLDRVHMAMLLQAGGRANALRALLKAEQDRGPDFLRLANALSALYPKGSEEKRLLDAMLLAVPR